MKYDVIIIGMGIAGVSAAIYAKQANKKVLILEGGAPGGLLNNIDKVSNYAGIDEITGPDLAVKLFDQIVANSIEYKLEKVESINPFNEYKEINTKSSKFQTKNIIIATGRSPKLLGLENEEKFLGKGISTCALCDGNFYKEKEIAVIGSGNSALQEALYLANIAKKVHLVVKRRSFVIETELVSKVKSKSNIEIHYESFVENLIITDEKITGLKLNNEEININGVFIYAGYKPNTEFLKELNILNTQSYIEVDKNLETNIEGVFAIGDVIKKDIYQLVSAAADGARVVGKLK